MKCYLLISLLFLSACSEVQYKPPAASEDSSELYVDNGGGSLVINSVNDEGCYVGMTDVSKSVRLHADKTIYLTYAYGSPSSLFRDSYCRSIISFIPESGEKYQLVGKNGNASRVGGPQCEVTVNRLGSAMPVVVNRLQVHQTRIACIKFDPY